MTNWRSNKLPKKLVEEIRQFYAAGHSCQQTADKFNIGKTTVRSYVDIRDKKTLTEKERKQRRVADVNKRRKKVKRMAVEYKGGCCSICGYDKCLGALDFHHIDSTKKDFGISGKGYCNSWEKVKVELDKCILVCKNCHQEIHEKLRLE